MRFHVSVPVAVFIVAISSLAQIAPLGFIQDKYAPEGREANGSCSASDKAPEVERLKTAGRKIAETGWKPTALPVTHGNH